MTNETACPNGLLSKRYGARIIDNIVMIVLGVPLAAIVAVAMAAADGPTAEDPKVNPVVTIAVLIVAALLYWKKAVGPQGL